MSTGVLREKASGDKYTILSVKRVGNMSVQHHNLDGFYGGLARYAALTLMA